jgi:hypothetical protein
MKNSMEALQKLKIELPYDPAIPLLGIYPRECKSGYIKGTCTLMFIVASDEWIKKMWYLYTMEFCSATKKNEIMSCK